MKKRSTKARGKALRPKPFEDNKVDFSKFKMAQRSGPSTRLRCSVPPRPLASAGQLYRSAR